MTEGPIDFNLIYRDKAKPAFLRVAAAAERAAAAGERAAEATQRLADTIRDFDDDDTEER